jgi:phospholipase C
VRLAPIGVAVLASVALSACGGASIPGTAALPVHHRTSSSSPIQHVIIVIQENRSFDDLFATFPNADGTTTGTGEPMPKAEASTCAKDNQQVVTQSKPAVSLTKVSLIGV